MQRLGLLLFASIFVTGGWAQIQQPTQRADQARKLGLPVPDELVQASGAAMIGAALALQIAPLRRLAALLLALQLVPITFVGHRFWELEPGPSRNGHRVHFFKNLSLIGAALALAGAPEGAAAAHGQRA